MNRRELIDHCLTYPDAWEDYPFDPLPDDSATAVIRHKRNRRSFALIMCHKGMLYLNLKCDPFEAELLRLRAERDRPKRLKESQAALPLFSNEA